MCKIEMDTAEIIKMASEAGARVALQKFREEHNRAIEEWHDRRLFNTKLLLENYRALNAYINNGMYEKDKLEDYTNESPYDILELMWQKKDGDVVVASIKESIERTQIIMEHVNTMLDIYKAYCLNAPEIEEQRRWRVIEARYIAPKCKSINKIAREEFCSPRTIQRDIVDAIERISSLLFGINGLRRMQK